MTDLFDTEQPTPSMTRGSGDHPTSKKAARKIAGRKSTARALVIEFAKRAPNGFTDEAMQKMRPDWAESTARKRRTELTEENIILSTGRDQINDLGNEMHVWIHRDFVSNPPPILPRKIKPTRKQVDAELKRLQGILDRHGIGY
ncbi:MAG: hypothetical protein ACJ75S_06815 [Solirubrobacterales bacterium]|jgi:hypothetical protein